MIKTLRLTALLCLVTLTTACNKPFRERFFAERRCPEITLSCLDEYQSTQANHSQKNQENIMFDPKKPYQLTAEDKKHIDERKTQRIYDEITQMLEIYYPGFWSDRADDKAYQMAWVAKVDEITKRYYPKRSRGDLEIMASICAIIGSDFEEKSEWSFIIKRLQSDSGVAVSITSIYDWLRFELLKKDYDDARTQYNNWSLRGAGKGMPPITRYVPDFDDEWLPDNSDENVWKIYKDTVREGGTGGQQ